MRYDHRLRRDALRRLTARRSNPRQEALHCLVTQIDVALAFWIGEPDNNFMVIKGTRFLLGAEHTGPLVLDAIAVADEAEAQLLSSLL